MVNMLLIIWSMLATAVVLVTGLVLTFSPHGATGPGVALIALTIGSAAACVRLLRIETGRHHRRQVYATVEASNVQTRRRSTSRSSRGEHRPSKATPAHA